MMHPHHPLLRCAALQRPLVDELIIIISRQRRIDGLGQLLLVALLLCQVDVHLGGRQRHLLHKLQVGVAAGGEWGGWEGWDGSRNRTGQKA